MHLTNSLAHRHHPQQDEAFLQGENVSILPPSYFSNYCHSGQDYLFSLLTGYCEPPAGYAMMPGLYYNPYFPGGAIAMPPPLSNDGVEYEDRIAATVSQQARDLVQFLNWCAEPEADTRKKDVFAYMVVLGATALMTGYYKRFRWSTLKTRSITYLK